MQKKFLKNLALLLVLNLLIKPFWILGIDRSVQNAVGPENYGFYFAILNFSFLFNILLDLGISNFNNRNISQNTHLLQKHLSNILVLKFLLGLVYLVFSIAAALVLKYTWTEVKLLLILCFNQFLISLVLYLRSNLAGLQLFKIDSVVSVIDRLLMIIFCGILLWGNVVNQFRIEYYVYAQTLSYLITFLAVFLILLHKSGTKIFQLNFNFPFFVMILRQSLPFALLVLLMTFYNRIDSVMLERMLDNGARQSGIYASAYRLLDASNMIAYLFAVLLLPIFSRMIKTQEAVTPLLKLSFVLIITPAIIMAAGCYFYSNQIMELLYPIHIDETDLVYSLRIAQSARVFGLLMICFVAVSTSYIFGTLLTANGSLKYLNIIAGMGMLVNITLNLFLIPWLQATGSAIASLTTQSFSAIAQVVVVFFIFKIKLDYSFFTKLIAFALGVISINFLSKMLPFDWKINFAIMLAASFFMAVITRFFNIKNILVILFKHNK